MSQQKIDYQKIIAALLLEDSPFKKIKMPMGFNLADVLKTFAYYDSLEFQKLVETLPKYGWFPDTEMALTEMAHATRFVFDTSRAQLDEFMVAYLSKNWTGIQNRLLSENPERAPILLEALDAHINEKYFLSTIAFLTQADGISHELLNANYFMHKKSKGKVANLDKEMLDPLFVAVLATKGEMRYSEHEGQTPGQLNRHLVIHGLDKSYGCLCNSLKAFSLLTFLSSLNATLKYWKESDEVEPIVTA